MTTPPTDDDFENNAKNVLPIRVNTGNTDKCHAQIREIIRVLCPFLMKDEKPLNIRPLTGGLSNHLFLVGSSEQDTKSQTVLVRIHPESGHHDDPVKENHVLPTTSFSIVNRELENRFAAWLASQQTQNGQKMAPTVYGRFQNGRVEEFYSNVRPLTCNTMHLYARYIAPQMAAFHRLPTPPSDILPRPTVQVATIYETVDAWLKEAQFLLARQSTMDDERALLHRLSIEWKWLKAQLSQPPPSTDDHHHHKMAQNAYSFVRRVTVTHMDCQPLNILVEVDAPIPAGNNHTTEEIHLRLIDFEYSGFNPAAADMGNTFCEYCEMSNLKADYEKEYPSPLQQGDFFWYYCQQYDDDTKKEFAIPDDRSSDDWKTFSAAMQHEVGRFSLLSHLGWAIWSVIKSKEEDGVDFDYIFYAKHRMDGYEWGKKKFFADWLPKC
jgi:thiamine kinase-like enzyme